MPPCSIVPKWKAAVFAIACRCLRGVRSSSLRGIAGCLPDREVRDGLRQGVAEVGVLRVAAVARPPAGVDGQLHQVGQPADLTRASRLAAGQRAELVQVDRLRAVRLQVRVDEVRVALLVVGVVVDVLGDVLVQHRERPGVGRVSASARDLAVLDPAELVVLLPEVGLEQLGRGEELENRHIAIREPRARGRGPSSQQAARPRLRLLPRRPLTGTSGGLSGPGLVDVFHGLLLQESGGRRLMPLAL